MVGRAPIVPAVDADHQTVEALRPLTPILARELADLLHLPRTARATQTARWRIVALRKRLRQATGRDDLIETTRLGYRLVAS